MDQMVRDMRNRFLVALALSIPIMLWSPMGRDMFGFTVPAPFGLRDDVFTLLLSLPVVFYSAWIFFDGAWRALRARTLDMMVLVAVAVGAGWLYSVGVTLTGGGEVFYEAAVGADNVRAAGALVRDARPRRRERRHPHAARAGAADGGGAARRRTGGDSDRRGDGRRSAIDPARAPRSRSTAPSRTATPRSTSRWSPAKACR